MKYQRLSIGNRERGSTLIFVVLGSFICLTIAVSLIAARHQAMKLAKRQQIDHLGHLDLTTQTSNLNGQIAAMVKQQNGTTSLNTSTANQFINQVAGTGGTIQDPTNSGVNPYDISIGQLPPAIVKTLPQYTPLSSNSFKLTPGTPLTVDPSDPLLGVQTGIPLGIMPVQLYAAPATDTNVFYPNKTSTLQYTFRQVPLSIYSLYATGSSSIMPGLLTGDAGRIYAGQSLAVSGAVTASRPVIAQQGVAFSDANASLSVSQATVGNPALAAAGLTAPAAQTLGGATDVTDQAQMSGGNQILTTGMQEKDLQNVPTTNFDDFVAPSGTSPVQLGSQCAFNIAYTAPAADKNGAVAGTALVSLQQGLQVTGLASLTLGVTQDSNTFNGAWDNFTLNLPKPTGYMAAVNSAGTRLMNQGGTGPAPMQFIVLDYARVTSLFLIPGVSASQTFYVQGDPATQAVLLRGGVAAGAPPGPTTGTINAGFSLVSNLDVYIYRGIGPLSGSANPAISIITPGQVHAAY